MGEGFADQLRLGRQRQRPRRRGAGGEQQGGGLDGGCSREWSRRSGSPVQVRPYCGTWKRVRVGTDLLEDAAFPLGQVITA